MENKRLVRAYIVDDNESAIELLRRLLGDYSVEIVGTSSDVQQAADDIINLQPDLLFLDVKMGEVNGVSLAKEIPQGTFLVFTTAYAQYAVDGFDLNAIDFLHKPFSFSRFEKAVNKVQQTIKLVNYSATPPLEGQDITVKVEYKNVTVQLGSILYIQAMDNYVKIYTVDSRPVITQMSMKSLEAMLPENEFVRVHKSYIVPRHRIESYSRTQLTLTGGTEIPVGRAYADKLGQPQ